MRKELSKENIDFIKKNIVIGDGNILLYFIENDSIDYTKHIVIYEQNNNPYCAWFKTNGKDVLVGSEKTCNIPFDCPI
jgi:hypothetical protein